MPNKESFFLSAIAFGGVILFWAGIIIAAIGSKINSSARATLKRVAWTLLAGGGISFVVYGCMRPFLT